MRKHIKELFILVFGIVITTSLYEKNIAPILTMAVGSALAGPLGGIIGAAIGISIVFFL